ncbi:putative reverse transcriptase domain-containing protein, partial [Tanacetum coccineum]
MRLRTNTKTQRFVLTEPRDGVTSHTRRRHNSSSDGITSFMTTSTRTDSNADLEDSSYDGVTTKTSACPRLNRAQGLEENGPNQVAANNGGQGRGNQENQARGRAFMLGTKKDRQDPNIVKGFISTTFIPLLGLEPSELGFKDEIEIASGQLVEIDKVIKGMDWLANYKAKIICHEKVVRIPLPNGKVFRVFGERPEEKARFLMGAKEIEFRIELTPGATPVAKSPNRLAPFELEELWTFRVHFLRGARRTLKFLRHVINGNRIHVDPSKIEAVKNWKAPRTLTEVPSSIRLSIGGEEHELAFQTLKDKLYNAPVLALPDGPEDFVVYCDAYGIGLGCVLMQR